MYFQIIDIILIVNKYWVVPKILYFINNPSVITSELIASAIYAERMMTFEETYILRFFYVVF